MASCIEARKSGKEFRIREFQIQIVVVSGWADESSLTAAKGAKRDGWLLMGSVEPLLSPMGSPQILGDLCVLAVRFGSGCSRARLARVSGRRRTGQSGTRTGISDRINGIYRDISLSSNPGNPVILSSGFR